MSIHVMSRVWDKSALSSTELLVLLALADRADEDGIAWPGIEYIANHARITPRQCKRVILSIQKRGELLVYEQRGRNRTNRYIIITGLTDDEIIDILQRREGITQVEALAFIRSGRETPAATQNLPGKKVTSAPPFNREKVTSATPFKSVKGDMQGLKGDTQGLKGDMQGLKGDTQGLKGDIAMSPDSIILNNPTQSNEESALDEKIRAAWEYTRGELERESPGNYKNWMEPVTLPAWGILPDGSLQIFLAAKNQYCLDIIHQRYKVFIGQKMAAYLDHQIIISPRLESEIERM